MWIFSTALFLFWPLGVNNFLFKLISLTKGVIQTRTSIRKYNVYISAPQPMRTSNNVSNYILGKLCHLIGRYMVLKKERLTVPGIHRHYSFEPKCKNFTEFTPC